MPKRDPRRSSEIETKLSADVKLAVGGMVQSLQVVPHGVEHNITSSSILVKSSTLSQRDAYAPFQWSHGHGYRAVVLDFAGPVIMLVVLKASSLHQKVGQDGMTARMFHRHLHCSCILMKCPME